jgi:hypothetical protein
MAEEVQLASKKTAPSAPLQLMIVANEKGGQGKSLLGLAMADHAALHGVALDIAQIDSQARLAKALGREVLTIDPVEAAARRDPNAEARSFTPVYAMLENAATSGASVLIDIGANQAHRFAYWAGLVELREDLVGWGFETSLWVPYLAEAEALRQAAHTVTLLREHLKSARLILVENEHGGPFGNFRRATERAEAYSLCIEPLKAGATVLRMPADETDAWPPFQAANCRLVDVAGMETEQVMSLTGLPRPEAKIARGDVAGWAGTIIGELDRVLPWSEKADV